MSRSSYLFVLLLIFSVVAHAQSKKDSLTVTNPPDSIKTDIKHKGIQVEEVAFVQQEINPLAPSKAAFYSAIFPGLGQVYNKRYWKVPIVWGAIGWSAYQFKIRNDSYNEFRDVFKERKAGLSNPDFDRFTDDALQRAQERLQRDKDFWLVITIGFYALNIIDANVDAHLKQYNVDDRLGLDVKPYFNLNDITGNPNYGLAFMVTF